MIPEKKMNDGRRIPMLGLGMWQSNGQDAVNAVGWATEMGYRHIDTAMYYKNEEDVGQAIRKCEVPRSELFVVSKVWPSDMIGGRTREAFDRSLNALGLDYLDMFLLHWPIGDVAEAWDTLQRLQSDGKIRSIGVSNFAQVHLEELMKTAKVPPAVNQIESNPYFVQQQTIDYCHSCGIAVEAWGPLGKGKVLSDAVIAGLAHKYGKTPAQIILRWHFQRGVIAIPKSIHLERLQENMDIFNFELQEEDIAAVSSLDTGATSRYYPAEFDPSAIGVIAPEGMKARD